jgi:hypothetical protein
MTVHVTPVPEYPVLHAHVLVPGPDMVHVALTLQPPLLVRHGLISMHVIPLPLYPGLQVQLAVLGPVDVH